MSPPRYQPIDSALTPRFAEPATFMRTPHMTDYDGLDIGLVGVPFDLGSTNRAGARHGPAQIGRCLGSFARLTLPVRLRHSTSATWPTWAMLPRPSI